MPIKLTLGTANLGLAYGTAIKRNLPSDDHAEAILRHARRRGFRSVDTARGYGLSEMRIGRHLGIGEGFHRDEISTKIAPLAELNAASSRKLGRQCLQESLAASRSALKTQRLQRVMLHRASHFFDAGGAIWQCLLDEQAAGGVAEVGVSVQTVDEARFALRQPDVDAIQLPCNILDWRFDSPEFTKMTVTSRRRPIKIDARSVFLQGVLVSGDASLFPALAVPYDPDSIVDWLQETANAFTGGAVDALCLRYVASASWMTSIVVGADTLKQIDRLAEIAEMGPLPPDTVEEIRLSRPSVPEALLNPSLWAFPENDPIK